MLGCRNSLHLLLTLQTWRQASNAPCLDWDAENDDEVDPEDVQLHQPMMRHYESLNPEQNSSGFFLLGLLAIFHQVGINFQVEQAFYT
jgi:hypothetical protein